MEAWHTQGFRILVRPSALPRGAQANLITNRTSLTQTGPIARLDLMLRVSCHFLYTSPSSTSAQRDAHCFRRSPLESFSCWILLGKSLQRPSTSSCALMSAQIRRSRAANSTAIHLWSQGRFFRLLASTLKQNLKLFCRVWDYFSGSRHRKSNRT